MDETLQVVLVESRGEGEEAALRGYAAARVPTLMRIAGSPAEAWRSMLLALSKREPALFAVSLAPATIAAIEVLRRIERDRERWLVPVLVEGELPLPVDALAPIRREQLDLAIEGVERYFARAHAGHPAPPMPPMAGAP